MCWIRLEVTKVVTLRKLMQYVMVLPQHRIGRALSEKAIKVT